MTVLEVGGVANVRDVGGLAAGSSRVRTGVLFRSGHLAQLTAEGGAALAARVRRVIDLRDDAEVEREPSALSGIPTTRIPLFLGSVGSFFAQNMDLTAMYRHLIDESASRLVDAVRIIAAGEPTLVHCTVGKDRTGVTVALALSAVGADRDAVIADYALTASQLPVERSRAIVQYLRANLPDATNAVQLATQSPAPVMAAMLADIDARFGSAAGYLRDAGMTAAELDALSAALLD
jgi:protein-tyrosine phosphatase